MNRKKKTSLIALLAVTVVASGLYTAYELRPPTAFVTGHGQYVYETFEEKLDVYPIVVQGKISKVETKIFAVTSEEIDENIPPNIISTTTEKIPNAKLTISISEVFKDDFGIDVNTVVVYDRGNGIGENSDGERTLFSYPNVVEHQVGDEGIFFIDVDNGRLDISGYTSYFPIIDGKTTVTSGYEKHRQETPIDLDLAKQLAREGQ